MFKKDIKLQRGRGDMNALNLYISKFPFLDWVDACLLYFQFNERNAMIKWYYITIKSEWYWVSHLLLFFVVVIFIVIISCAFFSVPLIRVEFKSIYPLGSHTTHWGTPAVWGVKCLASFTLPFLGLFVGHIYVSVPYTFVSPSKFL